MSNVLTFEHDRGQRVNKALCLLLLAVSAPVVAAGSGVKVELDTQLGPIRVEVFPQAAPLSACDFLAYTDQGLYAKASVT